MSVNKIILVGRLGKDPEVRHLQNDRAVANFSLATSEKYTNKQGEKVENTTWHNIVLWSPLAGLAEQYLKKGSQVYIEGKVTNRSYEDKEGQTRYITEVVGNKLVFLGSNGSQVEVKDKTEPQPAQAQATAQSSNDDDLTF